MEVQRGVSSSKHVPVVVVSVFVCEEGLLAFPTNARWCTSCHCFGPLPLTSVLRRGGQADRAMEGMAPPSITTDLIEGTADLEIALFEIITNFESHSPATNSAIVPGDPGDAFQSL